MPAKDNDPAWEEGNVPLGLAAAAAGTLESEPTSYQEISGFIKRIVEIVWLDAGHSGEGGGVWVTDRDVLQTFSQLKIQAHVHVSPHQISCPGRPWIREEKDEFVSILRELGVNVTESVHFQDEPRSLLNHFRVLNNF